MVIAKVFVCQGLCFLTTPTFLLTESSSFSWRIHFTYFNAGGQPQSYSQHLTNQCTAFPRHGGWFKEDHKTQGTNQKVKKELNNAICSSKYDAKLELTVAIFATP